MWQVDRDEEGWFLRRADGYRAHFCTQDGADTALELLQKGLIGEKQFSWLEPPSAEEASSP